MKHINIFSLATLLAFTGLTGAASSCQSYTVRKEIHDLTDQEWKTYLDTIRKAATVDDPRYGRPIWEVAAVIHNQLNSPTHGSCVFFPWHRIFVAWVEQQLQKINPEFAFFYWDSSREWDNAGESIIWDYLGRDSGQGPLSNIRFPAYGNAYISRGYSRSSFGNLPGPEVFDGLYQKSLSKNGYDYWASIAELYHGILHNIVGGGQYAMSSMYSPLDPVFYAHHSDFDRKWFLAQVAWNVSGHGSDFQIGGKQINGQGTCTFDTILPGFNIKIRDIIDGSNLCVRYAAPGEAIAPSVTTTSSSATSTSLSLSLSPRMSSSIIASAPSSSSSAFSSNSVTAPGSSSATLSASSSASPTGTGMPSQAASSFSSSPGPSATASAAISKSAESQYAVTQANKSGLGIVTPTLAPAASGTASALYRYAAPAPTSLASPKNTSSSQKATQCPQPLPDSWIDTNFKDSSVDGKALLKEALNVCHAVVEKVKAGIDIPQMPKVVDAPASRPVIAAPGDNAVYGGQPISIVPVTSPIMSSSVLERDATSMSMFALVTCLFFSIFVL